MISTGYDSPMNQMEELQRLRQIAVSYGMYDLIINVDFLIDKLIKAEQGCSNSEPQANS